MSLNHFNNNNNINKEHKEILDEFPILKNHLNYLEQNDILPLKKENILGYGVHGIIIKHSIQSTVIKISINHEHDHLIYKEAKNHDRFQKHFSRLKRKGKIAKNIFIPEIHELPKPNKPYFKMDLIENVQSFYSKHLIKKYNLQNTPQIDSMTDYEIKDFIKINFKLTKYDFKSRPLIPHKGNKYKILNSWEEWLDIDGMIPQNILNSYYNTMETLNSEGIYHRDTHGRNLLIPNKKLLDTNGGKWFLYFIDFEKVGFSWELKD